MIRWLNSLNTQDVSLALARKLEVWQEAHEARQLKYNQIDSSFLEEEKFGFDCDQPTGTAFLYMRPISLEGTGQEAHSKDRGRFSSVAYMEA